MPAPPDLAARILQTRHETPGAVTLKLSVPPAFTFIPGQWVMLQFPDKAEKANAYSMASSPLEKGVIELSLRPVGAFSEKLCAAGAGQDLHLRGPYGKWVYDDSIEHAVLICEGTGLAPYRSFGRYVRDKGLKNRLTFIYEQPHLLDTAEMTEAGFAVHTAHGALDQQVNGWKSAHYYLCGAKALVDRFKVNLASLGIPADQIHFETWSDYAWDSY